MQRPQPRLALFPEDLTEDLTVVARSVALILSVCADLKLSPETKYDSLALLVGTQSDGRSAHGNHETTLRWWRARLSLAQPTAESSRRWS